MAVSTLAYANPIPNRLAKGANVGDFVYYALDAELRRVAPDESPSVLLCQFALPYGPVVRNAALKHGDPTSSCCAGMMSGSGRTLTQIDSPGSSGRFVMRRWCWLSRRQC